MTAWQVALAVAVAVSLAGCTGTPMKQSTTAAFYDPPRTPAGTAAIIGVINEEGGGWHIQYAVRSCGYYDWENCTDGNEVTIPRNGDSSFHPIRHTGNPQCWVGPGTTSVKVIDVSIYKEPGPRDTPYATTGNVQVQCDDGRTMYAIRITCSGGVEVAFAEPPVAYRQGDPWSRPKPRC